MKHSIDYSAKSIFLSERDKQRRSKLNPLVNDWIISALKYGKSMTDQELQESLMNLVTYLNDLEKPEAAQDLNSDKQIQK